MKARLGRTTHRGLCYTRRMRSKAVHYLTEVDVESKSCVCSICGPTKLYVRMSQGKPKLACANKRREMRQRENDQVRFKKYGLTFEQVDDLLEEQKHRCAICREALDRSFHIDHSHESGVVRGLLCRQCNLGLGHFRDNPDWMIQAASYLARGITLSRASYGPQHVVASD
jgi:hypothetical protein